MTKTITTARGTWSIEHDGYTPHENPDMTSYTVYFNDEDVGEIHLHYDCSHSYSQTHGTTYYRAARQYWSFTVYPSSIGLEAPSFDVFKPFNYPSTPYGRVTPRPTLKSRLLPVENAVFPPKEFATYVSASKHFIKLFEDWIVDTMEVNQ